ncbi:Crp/Fnr family transcriptional regulator [Algoriphagus sp. D3-2-R+10]|uniref:Crp/Fnr family transcriptional regulator n=1 Tax=Algoriphagus aurantiacus TaxID=3103948 RepID=UPI002B37B68D|nr:Crp/Fnr family transcriptional regulator [Algoriphagus sp. D3-2-R+10]MEB2773866.1 Crp/Fnr family transcriptional regulator [Algoriphagus sp. D3-2-R+10]
MDKEAEKYFKKFRLHIEKYVKIGDPEMDVISGYFSVKRIGRKTDLLEPGNICRFENFVVSGLFQSSVLDESGKVYTLNFPHEDWWAGDFKSFSNRSPSIMRIEALEDSILLEISKSSLDELLASSQSFASYFRILSENASIAANDRIITQLSQSAEQRYELFCQKYSVIKDRLSQKRISSFLGISPEYFNQIDKRKKSHKT